MLQEVRALPEQLPKNWDWPDYETFMHTAEKKVIRGSQHYLEHQWK